MKKLASLVCALALVFAVSAPAYAASSTVEEALSGTVTVHGYRYSLTSGDITRISDYLTAHGMTVGNKGDIIAAIDGCKAFIEAHSNDMPDAVWSALTLERSDPLYATAIADLNVGGTPTFEFESAQRKFTIRYSAIDSLEITPVRTPVSTNNNNPSPSTPTTTPPSSTSTTTTGANGGTAVSVSAAPDAAPVVSGGTSSFGVTIPSSLVSSGISSATAEKPAQVSITAPTDTLVGQLNSTGVQTVSMNLTVPSEIAYGTAANVAVSMNVDSAVLAAAKQTGKDVSISVTDSLSGKVAYSWTFKGSDLAASGNELKDVNLSMNVKSTVLDPTLSSAVPSDKKGVVLTFADNGTLPGPAAVSVYVGDQGFAAGQTVYLYYYNQATGKIESVEYPSATVDANGYASFVITHCSQYVAVPQQIAGAVASLKIDTGSKLTVKAGKTYQFKITASSVPAFVSGNNSVFQVTANGSKGNDYFFKVTAVGKVGQSAGFYVNGAKTPATVGTIA